MLVHKKSCTFLKELRVDQFLGEVEFFSGHTRAATARSKDFSEVLALNKQEFFEAAENFPQALETYDRIKFEVN